MANVGAFNEIEDVEPVSREAEVVEVVEETVEESAPAVA